MPDRREGPLAPLLGVEGNERLTTVAGLALSPLFIAEILTLLALGALIGAHIFIGLWLIVPLAIKLASTGYRFSRYYTGNPEYVRAGPPRWAPRLLAPVVVVASLALVGSGVAMWALGPPGLEPWRLIHKLSFQVWWISVAAHVLLHLGHIGRDVVSDFIRRQRGYLTRSGVVGACLLAGLLVAVALLAAGPSWPAGSSGG